MIFWSVKVSGKAVLRSVCPYGNTRTKSLEGELFEFVETSEKCGPKFPRKPIPPNIRRRPLLFHLPNLRTSSWFSQILVLTVMFDYSEVAVEIWHQILLAVIDLPYILDTLVDKSANYWRTSAGYDAPDIYEESEQQRKTLRLVCHSWRAFVDEHRHRYITYDARASANPVKQKEALEAINSATSDSAAQGVSVPSKPRRIMFHVTNDDDMAFFRTTITSCSSKVTTLFVLCTSEYQDSAFDYLIIHSSKLLNLRCLAISPPNGHPMPLRAVSTAFPKLYTFTIWAHQVFQPTEGDVLALPNLQVLELDLSVFQAADINKWHLPGVFNSRSSIGKDPQGPQTTLEPLRALGTNLTFIDIYRIYAPIRLPAEFWTWFPRLNEMLASYSWVYLDSPVPAGHPLKYIVHWPYYDLMDNPLIARTSNMMNPVVLQTLQFLPPSLELLILWHHWSDYLNLLSSRNHDGQNEPEKILIRMNEICVERSIKVEDRGGVALEDFLTKEGIGERAPVSGGAE
jgi:hypothetical protein